MTASDFDKLFENGEYISNTRFILASGKYDGKGATLIAPLGVEIISSDVILKDLNVKGKITISSDVSDVIIEGCSANDILSYGSYVEIRENKLEGNIKLSGECCLIAQNEVAGEISVNESYNCSVILNKANSVSAKNNKDVFIIDNEVSGTLSLVANDRVIADGNRYEYLDSSGNLNENGDTLHDVDERVEFGACEKLLPHTDKDLFVGMSRRSRVRDAEMGELPVTEYVREKAASESVVILAPGAYSSDTLKLENEHSHTTLYAYGALLEQTTYDTIYSSSLLSDLEIKGLTAAYALQSAYQLHVISKDDEKKEATFVCAAGMCLDPGPGKGRLFVTEGAQAYGFSLYSDLYPWGTLKSESIRRNDDGTVTYGFNDENYDRIKLGDVVSHRLSSPTASAFSMVSNRNVTLKDVTLYGISCGLAFVEHESQNSTRYIRVHNTNHSPYVIDRETYELYEALEEKYGIDLEISIDELGRYRGAIPRVGSVDATHVMACAEGVTAISCLFENMCDDGSNHRSSSGRLHSLTDNGDGTTTLEYKNSLGSVYAKHYGGTVGGVCRAFREGDRVYAYTSKGQLLCDTPALEPSREVGKGINEVTGGEYTVYATKVKTSDLCLKVLKGYDLSDNHYEIEHKVFVDNTDRNSQGFRFDNVLVQGIRSRGFMVKAPNGTISHTTYRNLDMAAVACKAEVDWGESTIAKDITISHCLFANTGRFNNMPDIKMYAPVIIQSLCKYVGPNSLLHSNIVIDHNKFMNCQNKRAIYVNSVRDVKITDNVFCPIENESEDNLGISIDVETAMNVEISGNTYSPNVKTPLDAISVTNACGIYGKDVEDENGNPLIPDSVFEYEPD
ncbi:MAG: hypothetical protein E7611_08450 [Ruminococcaceae bacterium]|nr:hypothetical protein [Oscillospiraceae bacterium]